eukprot:207829-Pleurochrysis_carterae.AAC.1
MPWTARGAGQRFSNVPSPSQHELQPVCNSNVSLQLAYRSHSADSMAKNRYCDLRLCTIDVIVYLAIYFFAFSCTKHVANILKVEPSGPSTL